MYEKLLENTGLTRNESSVYLTLLRIGKSRAGLIIKESKISSGKIYETLDKLLDKGLVKTVSENGIKHFMASSPNSLLIYMGEKEHQIHKKKEEIKDILPKLYSLSKLESKSENVSLINGFRGIEPVVFSALEKGKEIRILGVRSDKGEKFNNFWKKWHRRRIELKKHAKILFSDKNTDYWNYFKKMKYTQLRAILTFSPSALLIIDDQLFILSYDGEFKCIHVHSESVSESFSGFFDGLWDFAEK